MNVIDKAYARDIAHQFLLGQLIRASSKRFKTLSVPFERMPQQEQQQVLAQLAEDCRIAVSKAVEIIASDFRVTLRAACDSVAFKPDGVKAVLNLANTADAHALANAAGSTVLVVIEDAERYLEEGDATEGDPDQRTLRI